MRFGSRSSSLLFLVSVVLVFVACSHKPPGKRYELEGRVVAVDPAARQLTIAHKDIAGLMPGMTMPFIVSQNEAWIFGKIATGDQVHATLVLGDRAELEDISFSRGTDNSGDGTSKMRIPQPGDEVPDFMLTNQDGATIHFRQFRGKPLLLTFIYTRCPFPDYCPRMSYNFAVVMQNLKNSSQANAKAQLLSISIDPEHDRPADLHGYGERYARNLDPKFQHWQFATGSPEEIRKAADFFGLAYNSKEGQIVHNLSTALIGSDGKVLKVYSGGDWTPEQVAADYVAATREPVTGTSPR
jgi:protein SCO1/2